MALENSPGEISAAAPNFNSTNSNLRPDPLLLDRARWGPRGSKLRGVYFVTQTESKSDK